MKVQFIDEAADIIGDVEMEALPRVGEKLVFRAKGDVTTGYTVASVTHWLEHPGDAPAAPNRFVAQVKLKEKAAN